MYKIYTKGNYLFIENTSTNIRIEGLSKDVLVRTKNTDSDVFYFKNMNSSLEINNGINVSQMIDDNDEAYTRESFIDFYTSNTGGSISVSGIDGNA